MAGDYGVTLTNPNDAFKALKGLTVGRTKNYGTLQVKRSDGKGVRLECINHHMLPFGNGKEITRAMAEDLQRAVKEAFALELDKLAKTLTKSVDTKSADQVFVKINSLKRIFEGKMSIMGENGQLEPLTRARIGELVQQVIDLEKCLTADVDRLLKFEADDLLEMANEAGFAKVEENLSDRDKPAKAMLKQNGKYAAEYVESLFTRLTNRKMDPLVPLRQAAQALFAASRRMEPKSLNASLKAAGFATFEFDGQSGELKFKANCTPQDCRDEVMRLVRLLAKDCAACETKSERTLWNALWRNHSIAEREDLIKRFKAPMEGVSRHLDLTDDVNQNLKDLGARLLQNRNDNVFKEAVNGKIQQLKEAYEGLFAASDDGQRGMKQITDARKDQIKKQFSEISGVTSDQLIDLTVDELLKLSTDEDVRKKAEGIKDAAFEKKSGIKDADIAQSVDRLAETVGLSDEQKEEVVRLTQAYLMGQIEGRDAEGTSKSASENAQATHKPSPEELKQQIANGTCFGTRIALLRLGKVVAADEAKDRFLLRQFPKMKGDTVDEFVFNAGRYPFLKGRPFEVDSLEALKFCAKVANCVHHLAIQIEAQQKDETHYRGSGYEMKLGFNPSKENIRAVVEKEFLASGNLLKTLRSPKLFETAEPMEIIGKAVKENNDYVFSCVSKDDINRGFNSDFLRCQTSDTQYTLFSFDGQMPPKGVAGDDLDQTGNFARIENAGLQRRMKEMIPDPKMRAYVTSLHGLQGFTAVLGDYRNLVQNKLDGLDLGYGKVMDFFTDKMFLNSISETHSRKYELTVRQEDEGKVLYLRQSINVVPEMTAFLGARADFDYPMSKNEFALSMRIPLEQNLEGEAVPKCEIVAIEQSDDVGNRIVYHPSDGVCEKVDAAGNRTVMPRNAVEKYVKESDLIGRIDHGVAVAEDGGRDAKAFLQETANALFANSELDREANAVASRSLNAHLDGANFKTLEFDSETGKVKFKNESELESCRIELKRLIELFSQDFSKDGNAGQLAFQNALLGNLSVDDRIKALKRFNDAFLAGVTRHLDMTGTVNQQLDELRSQLHHELADLDELQNTVDAKIAGLRKEYEKMVEPKDESPRGLNPITEANANTATQALKKMADATLRYFKEQAEGMRFLEDAYGIKLDDIGQSVDRLAATFGLSAEKKRAVILTTANYLAGRAKGATESFADLQTFPSPEELKEQIASGTCFGTRIALLRLGVMEAADDPTGKFLLKQLPQMDDDTVAEFAFGVGQYPFLADQPFPADSLGSVKFCAMVAKAVLHLADLAAKTSDRNYQELSCARILGANPSLETIRKAVRDEIFANKPLLVTLDQPKQMTPVTLKRIGELTGKNVAGKWRSRVTEAERKGGFTEEFLRCQTSAERYRKFTFNGEMPPKGKDGDELDRTGGFASIENAGLQKLMKETITDPKIRAFVTSMCGLEGISGVLVTLPPDKTDLGYGKLVDFIINKCTSGKFLTPSSTRFDLTVNQDGTELIFKQICNATPPLVSILGWNYDNDDAFSLTENELSVTMRIPLDQNLADGEMPKYEVTDIENSDAEGNRVVYHLPTGRCEKFDVAGNRTQMEFNPVIQMFEAPLEDVRGDAAADQVAEANAAADNAANGVETVAVNARVINQYDGKPTPMETLKLLARYVGGAEGGHGYMGIDKLGNIVKFLENEGESIDGPELTDAEKKLINAATDTLRNLLLGLATGVNPERQAEVRQLLPSDAVRSSGFKAFISRETVAKVIGILAEEIKDGQGKSLDWGEVKDAAVLSNSTVEKVFNLDFERRVAFAADKFETDPTTGAKNLRGAVIDQIKSGLKDSDVQKKLAEEVRPFTTAAQIEMDADDDVTHVNTQYQYVEMDGGSTAVANKILEEDPNAKVSIMGYGDDSLMACYWYNQVGTQEEQLFQNLDPSIIPWFKAQGFVTPEGTEGKMRYVGTAGNDLVGGRLSPADGIHIPTKLLAADHKPLSRPKDVGVLIGALPSLTPSDNSKDLIGNFDFLIKSLAKIGKDREVLDLLDAVKLPVQDQEAFKKAADKLTNAYKFVCEFRKELKKLNLPKELFAEAMKIMIFGGRANGIDFFSSKTSAQVAKLIGTIKTRDTNPTAYDALLATAQKNYLGTLKQTFKEYIIMERELGTTHLVIGPIGCGVFLNDSEDVAACFAEMATQYGGNMKIVYPVYGGKISHKSMSFRRAFEKVAQDQKLTGRPERESSDVALALPPNSEAHAKHRIAVQTENVVAAELGGLGEFDIDYGQDGAEVRNEIRYFLKLADRRLENIRSAYAFVINILTQRMKDFRKEGIEEKTRTDYLQFLKEAKAALALDDLKQVRPALNRALSPLETGKGKGIWKKVDAALDAVAEYFERRDAEEKRQNPAR